jgi:hypothetical protein
MNLSSLPLFDELKASKNILIAGAGGGFDVFSGLPIYFALRNQGKNVFLANLSFANLADATGIRLSPAALLVNADSTLPDGDTYFPEKYLCEWFRAQGEEIEICCFHNTAGVLPVQEGYESLCRQWNIDSIILADGGTDSLMRGDEADLGTPQEDMISIAAVNALPVSKSFLVCTAFGVDAHHGVCHAQYLENVAALAKTGNFLGAFSFLKEMKEVELYQQAYQHVEARMSYPSIVCTSVISAVNGEYGDYHATSRTRASTLWINPLMSICWVFRLTGVAARCLYLDLLKHTVADYDEIKAWQSIPV